MSAGIDKTLQERGSNYGPFEGHARIAQQLKSVMRDTPKWADTTPEQREALEMIVHKIARLLNGRPDHQDSWHDIAGYATLVENRIQEKKKGDPT